MKTQNQTSKYRKKSGEANREESENLLGKVLGFLEVFSRLIGGLMYFAQIFKCVHPFFKFKVCYERI